MSSGKADLIPYNEKWLSSVALIIETMTTQQLSSAEDASRPDGPAYNFQRDTTQPTDTLNHGSGWPAAHTGMIKSAFRGSDDACKFNFNIPENAMAVVALREVASLLSSLAKTMPLAGVLAVRPCCLLIINGVNVSAC